MTYLQLAITTAFLGATIQVRGQTAPSPQPLAPGTSGQQLVAEAAKRVASELAISADLRYRIDAFGHELVGTGNYLQYGSGADKLLRLDLRMQVGDKPATVQEIRGDESYWIRRDVPPTPPSLGRVDLRQLRKSLAQSSGQAASDVLPQGDWIMLGGLSRLLASLEQNFEFTAPRAEELRFNADEGKTIVRLPIWRLAGQWKPERLATLAEREPGKSKALPEQLPDRVEIVLGRTEDVLPLFPYRITYWRTPPRAKGATDEPGEPRELLTLELFNVSRKRIDLREFQYQPGDQDVQNLTPFYVQRYSGETKLR
ncbi:MAG: hypothetical protein JF612_01560 [Planctomycetia bacterium]|nr:hypothetical protein [Planctomycetia bacterium]